MAENTAISWASATWNPWRGCTKISPGCKNCYMFRDQIKYGHDPEVVVRSKTTFIDPRRWAEPQRIFTCSWSDFFHEAADPWRAEAWDIIQQTPEHLYLILTKRPERIAAHLPLAPDNRVTQHYDPTWPWTNVWLGVSVETQKYTSRMDVLRQVPVHGNQRFVSAEPLLGPLELDLAGFGWVITGGESGPGHRPMEPDWCRSIRDQCKAAGVMYHHKQGSHLRPGMDTLLDGVEHRAVPGGAM